MVAGKKEGSQIEASQTSSHIGKWAKRTRND